MSPTVLRKRGFRLLFFSREEPRMHVQAKVWLEPRIEVAESHGLDARQVRAAVRLIQEHEHEICAAWKEHFGD